MNDEKSLKTIEEHNYTDAIPYSRTIYWFCDVCNGLHST